MWWWRKRICEDEDIKNCILLYLQSLIGSVKIVVIGQNLWGRLGVNWWDQKRPRPAASPQLVRGRALSYTWLWWWQYAWILQTCCWGSWKFFPASPCLMCDIRGGRGNEWVPCVTAKEEKGKISKDDQNPPCLQ